MGHLISGSIAVCVGLFGVFVWWDDFGLILRGLIPLTFLVVGLVGIGAGLAGRKLGAGAPPRVEPRPEPDPIQQPVYDEPSMDRVSP